MTGASSWLDPVRQVLEEIREARTVFVRDDDGGWGDSALVRLLDLLQTHDVVPDVAVIPNPEATDQTGGLSASVIGVLSSMAQAGAVRLHQHGWRHVNHEPQGRKCEFGASRTRSQQRADLQVGAELLTDRFGTLLDPVFTPPWNRCTVETGRAMLELGLRVLSRDVSAGCLGLDGLLEIPVTVDWFGKSQGIPWDTAERGLRLARSLRERPVTGIMLHHAITGEEGRRQVGHMAALLAGSSMIELRPMADIASQRPDMTGRSFTSTQAIR